MSTGNKRSRWRWWIGCALLASIAAVGVCWGLGLFGPPNQDKLFPLPPVQPSRYLNTGPDAQYIGIAACAECHKKNHSSYLLTAHSRALADINLAAEPPDASFFHRSSGRHYRVYRQDNQLRHEEVLRGDDGKELARIDLPIRHVIGSGHFTRSYLVEQDGLLLESPLTWYSSRKHWDLSPGFDTAQHPGFERQVTFRCLFCHAGRVEEVPNSTRLVVKEQGIDCERCHGPGSLHAQLHRSPNARKPGPGEEDLTIVNPGKLPRPLLEAVCEACHQSSFAGVELHGRRVSEHRPGQALLDFRIDYRLTPESDQMTVVGHMEQLRRSVCYQKSSELSCLSCHDPHAKEAPKDPTAFYRQKCLNCHTAEACGVELVERRKKTATDSCLVCHMPVGATDIPHLAFTNHRIGRQPQPSTAPNQGELELVPAGSVAHLPLAHQQRNLGLAYVRGVEDGQAPRQADPFLERARALLEPLHEAGMRDGSVASALAVAWMRKDLTRAGSYAERALNQPNLPGETRGRALAIRAAAAAKAGDYRTAIKVLQELTSMRRQYGDWHLLGRCYQAVREPEEALAAFQKAGAISPYDPELQADLGQAYRARGDAPKAREHLDKSQWLLQHAPR